MNHDLTMNEIFNVSKPNEVLGQEVVNQRIKSAPNLRI